MCTMWQHRYTTGCASMVAPRFPAKITYWAIDYVLTAVVTDCLTCELQILHQFIFYLRSFREYYDCIHILQILGQGQMQSFIFFDLP